MRAQASSCWTYRDAVALEAAERLLGLLVAAQAYRGCRELGLRRGRALRLAAAAHRRARRCIRAGDLEALR